MIWKKKIMAAIVVAVIVIAYAAGSYGSMRQEIRDICDTPVQPEEYYTPLSYAAYQDALADAQEIALDLFAGARAIDDAAYALQDSIDALKMRADKEPLQQVLDTAAELVAVKNSFLPSSWEPVADALAAAELVMADENAVDADVLVAINQIDAVVKELIAKPDKTELTDRYNEAAGIDTSVYRPSTVRALKEVLSSVENVLDNENAAEEDVKRASTQLAQAVSELDLVPDKSELEAAIEAAEKYEEEKYTTVTYNALQDAIDNATSIINNDDAAKKQVDAVLTALNKAVEGLQMSTTCVWEISFYLQKTATNHVGNSWSKGVFYQGEQVWSGFEVTAREGAGITLIGKAVENDNIPDVGSGSVYLILKDGNEAETTFYVRENRGRYAGNCAVWDLEVSCELIERI